MELLKREKEGEGDDEEIEEFEENSILLNNEFEEMLHRKIYELNQLQTEYHELQLQLQKEKSLRLKAEEEIAKINKQHESEKKNLAINIKNTIQDHFERKVMNVGIMYKKELKNLNNQFRDLRMDLMGSEYLIGKLIGMFTDQETLLSYIRARVRINFKGEMGLREIVGMESGKTLFQKSVYKQDHTEVRDQLIDLNERYEDLERNYQIAKEVSESMTDDWRNSELRAREFEKLYEEEKVRHQDHIKELLIEFEEREKKWHEEK
eukprot:CAMPEP_0197018310 /NCGR_PEP_ID=MMETSP1380-20130617/80028_1 /TAXON_ID=5936 /ORGANISM="Euplotes crassus, Strain CT5" /LENGTH=263 /DNA_ID=CAMNT_0042445511 /DNA_START=78 /DNA_END=870 /DNA_ORIENTATION=+